MKKKTFSFSKKENTLYIDMEYIMPVSEILNPTKIEKGDSYVNYTNSEWIEFSDNRDEILKEIAKHPGCTVMPIYYYS